MELFDGPIFVINLKDSDVRLQSAKEQLTAVNLDFQRIEAVDGRNRLSTDFANYDSDAAVKFFGRDLKSGEIGCYLSHVKAAQAFLDSGAELGLVFEDDFRGVSQSWQIIQELTKFLKLDACPDWEMINLGRAPRLFTRKLTEFSTDSAQTYTLFQAFYFPVIATAILWSKDGAARFLEEAAIPEAPVDHMFRYLMSQSGMGLALDPAPFSILNGTSDIAQASQNTHQKIKANWLLMKKSEASRQMASFKRAIFRKWMK
ncbi:MAG: glycosyltransferase family 25 protein [Pseudomonadota bacterium]